MPSVKLKLVETATYRAVRAELMRRIAYEILDSDQIDDLEVLVAGEGLVQAQLYMSDRIDDCVDNEALSEKDAAKYYRMIALPAEQVSRHRQERYANAVAQLAEAKWEEIGTRFTIVRCH